MPSIADIVDQLSAAPKPVICLDTCDILEVVQCLGWEKQSAARNTACVNAASRLLTTLAADPDKVLVVITELVAHEWRQNIAEICEQAKQFLSHVDGIVDRVYRAAVPVGTSLAAFAELSKSDLVDNLVTLSNALLDQAIQIDLDDGQVKLAVQRVLKKRRPSHKGQLKDSIHFEHYLELARQLRATGFAEECIIVSKNKTDFWDPSQAAIHPDLASEIADVTIRIRFFCSLEAALVSLDRKSARNWRGC